ncbi:HEAT repeat-containing protein 3 [Phlebotomus argentipes]|uniref:HEAT repeat-containing protein 3 n=1 Tax=Phlebotomus argentipes TaxID=94469 RepID=UPI0028937C75|nr:HEAT repeat-containing protein 3 [Phlebotomus argentipes]
MGKTRKQRVRNGRADPIGQPELEDLVTAIKSDGPVPVILDQLQSPSVEEKLSGLQMLSTICQSQQNIIDILESDVIRVAAPLLMDRSSSALRQAAAGAFRNMSLCGMEMCEVLVEQDVLTPLLHLLKIYAEKVDWTPTFDAQLGNQPDEVSDAFLQAVNLLWNLCESTSIAVDVFNQADLLESFVRCLNFEAFGMDIAIAVCQCLLIISEDNPTSWRVLSSCGAALGNLLALEGGFPEVLLRTLAAGIMANIPALSEPYLQQILTSLARTLDENHRTVLSTLTSDLPLLQKQDVPELEVTEESRRMEVEESDAAAARRRRMADLPTPLETKVKHVGWLLEAQRVAGETLTNLSSADDENNAEDFDEESDAESVNDFESSSSGNLQSCDKLPVEILEGIKSLSIIEKLWQRAQPVPENVYHILKECESSLTKKLKTLRISALLCLQNLCNTMSIEDLGGASAIYNVWLDLGQQVFQGDNDAHLLEASTALMRASLEHLRGCPELFEKMTQSDLQLMLNGVESCSEAEIRANWLRMLGILGCLLPENLVKVIMTFIIETSLKENDAWAISEAVDALMDMFSDNDWLQIVHEVNLVQKSRELERLLKAKLRMQKRDLGDRYPAVATVRTNLARFTKYIEAGLKKYKAQT